RAVLEQFNSVSWRLKNRDRDFSTRHAGDFAGQVTLMMRPMGKLEAEDILPERERPFDV
ncbi:MAG: hypothetical protein QOE34_1117, partial [Verrucomicrobiota bacterium]